MKHNGFEVKISDLLNGKITDKIVFENKKISEIKNLTDKGISGTVFLQSLDQDSLLVTIDELSCAVEETCDRCGATFCRNIMIEGYIAKYVTTLDPEGKDTEEDIMLIDIRNGVIDLEEMFYHAIQLQEPFIVHCPDCESLPMEEDEDW